MKPRWGKQYLPQAPTNPSAHSRPQAKAAISPPSKAKRTDTKRVWLGTLAHPPPQLPKPGRKPKASGLRPWPPPAVKTATCTWSFPRPRGRIKFALFRTAGALPLSNSIRKIRQITHYCQNVTQHGQGGGVAGFSHSPHFNIYCDHYHQVQIQIQSDRNPNPKCVPHCHPGLGVVSSGRQAGVVCWSLSPPIAPPGPLPLATLPTKVDRDCGIYIYIYIYINNIYIYIYIHIQVHTSVY